MSEKIQTIGNPRKYIYKVVNSGGRFGNVLFEYFFWRLLAMNNHKIFKNTIDVTDSGQVKDLGNVGKPTFPRPFNKLSNYENFKNSELIPSLNKYKNQEIHDFPMNFKYYSNYRDLLRSFIGTSSSRKIDIVVHVRLDNDVFSKDEPLYTILPLSFYKDALASIAKKHGSLDNKKILVIGRPLTDLQKKIFNDIVSFIKEETGSKFVRRQSGTISEDMTAMMSAKIMICAVSTFWFWPVYLSKVCNEIHVPMFGQTKAYHFFENIGPNDKIRKTDKMKVRTQKDGFTIYGYKIGISRKITIDKVGLMYSR